MDLEKIRQDFPLLQKDFDGQKLVYFDNGATTLKPIQVIEAINYYYKEIPSNIHRGLHRLSQESSELYEESKKITADFLNTQKEEIIYTKNTTESINLIAYCLKEMNYFKPGDEILISEMEHHSNLLPWQFLERTIGIELKYVDVKNDFTLDMEDFQNKVSKKTRLVSVAHASNTIATINPAKEITKQAKEVGALVSLDCAQSAPHFELDAKDLKADFISFSSHKMLGPTGLGVLWGKKELLEEMPPFLYGGGMISKVDLHSAEWAKLPDKFEAGTPNIAGAIGHGTAIKYLQKIGMNNIRQHEIEITEYAKEKLKNLDKIEVFNPEKAENQTSVILFGIADKISCHDLSTILDEELICTRSGFHCAEPIVSKYNKEGLARASMYLYNTKEEVDRLVDVLKKISESF